MPASVFTALDADWTPFINSPPANLDELVARI